MQNDAGEFVDLYCPRKCSASNRLIHAKDHASVQLVIADVDPATGRAADTSKMYVVCGAIRRMGESDDCIVRLTKKDGILAKLGESLQIIVRLRDSTSRSYRWTIYNLI
ncbi:40S ribosomal protein S21 [Eumeta japonica]|uniref:Small ribosomal subunit protein eS21 n=1 Tax=Eumeta variegata TaxID=151549 RepID=A0A4C1VKF5_EUMVA|nr:40S ribosomal protein S21 [Eumeta japonica]